MLRKFCKYQGTGNDFIILEALELEGLEYSEIATKLCHRRFGIGADGLIIVAPSEVADVQMIFYNADGTIATMCGNGIRCFAKYVYDYQIVPKTLFTVETLAGLLMVELVLSHEDESLFRVNMGHAIYQHESIPVLANGDRFINQTLEVEGVNYTVNSLILGTIHTVLFVEQINEEEVRRVGSAIENHPSYPNKTNVNFCRIIDSHNIEVLTWEKGVGLTLACGTGSAACALLSQDYHDCAPSINVHVRGGKLLMERVGEDIYMTGPATWICKGECRV